MSGTPAASTRRFAAVSLCAGALAAVALPGNRAGLGLAVVGLAAIAAVLVSGERRQSHFADASLVLSGALACLSFVRAAGWVVALDLAGAAVMLVAGSVDARSWRALGVALRRTLRALLPALPAVARFSGVRLDAGTRARVTPVARGLALGATLVLVFGALFASADEAFAQIADRVLSPDVNLGLVPARVFAGLATVAVCGAVVLAAASPAQARAANQPEARRSPEWLIALGLVNLLFALFLVVQLRVLFGGDDHVLHTAGLTYAQYARQGFYQLLVVAFLVLALVAYAARRRGVRTGRRPTPVEAMLGLLCVLTLVVLVSALRRLGLLEDTYGFTLTRLNGHAMTIWVGVVLVLVLAAGAARRTDLLARAVVLATAAGLLAFSLLNPEGIVAARNVDRYEHTGKIDTGYLYGLGPDATPALRGLPRRELVRVQPDRPAPDGVFGWNLARSAAR